MVPIAIEFKIMLVQIYFFFQFFIFTNNILWIQNEFIN